MGFSRSSRRQGIGRPRVHREFDLAEFQDRDALLGGKEQLLSYGDFVMNRVLFPDGGATKPDGIVGILPRKRREDGKQNFAEFHGLVFRGHGNDGGSPQKIAQPFWARPLDGGNLLEIDPTVAAGHKGFKSPADSGVRVGESGKGASAAVASGFESFARHRKARLGK